MGCTSSASNTPQSQKNSVMDLKQMEETGDKSTEEAEADVTHSDKENETNRIKVLPTCDNLGESTQLARNKKSFIDASSLDLEKEFHGNGHVIDGDNMTTNKEPDNLGNTETEDKLSKLEEVVDKVVELHAADNASGNPQNAHNSDDAKESTDKPKDQAPSNETENYTNEEETENAEDIASPSQSESSRATRWEALADIAAELPPSLAVDPITGQIYALSK